MTGCDEEREFIRQSLKTRVTPMTDEQRQAAKGLQDAYGVRAVTEQKTPVRKSEKAVVANV